MVDKSAFEPDARARAVLRGLQYAHEDLRDAGGAYDLDQARAVLNGVSRQAIGKRVKEGSLLALPGPNGRRSYPTFQFTGEGTVIDGLKAVQEALPNRNPWSVLNFPTNPQAPLGGRKPIDLLRAGKLEAVVEAARGRPPADLDRRSPRVRPRKTRRDSAGHACGLPYDVPQATRA